MRRRRTNNIVVGDQTSAETALAEAADRASSDSERESGSSVAAPPRRPSRIRLAAAFGTLVTATIVVLLAVSPLPIFAAPQRRQALVPLEASTLKKFVDVLPLPPKIALTYLPPSSRSGRIRQRQFDEEEDTSPDEDAQLGARQTDSDFPDIPDDDENFELGAQWQAAAGKLPRGIGLRARWANIKMATCRHQFHKSLNATKVFCFNGVYPGPTIIARRFRSVQVTWTNSLPSKHLFSDQLKAAGATAYANISTKAVVHLHGAQSLGGLNDGHPMYAYPRGRSQQSWYPNLQKATHLFYHDHAMGATAPNFYSGLYGNYLIRDGVEDQLIMAKQLPPRAREIPLTIADKLVSTTGQLIYALQAGMFVGNVMSVNGKLYPYTVVQATTYRFRILNACNGRFLNLWLETQFPGVKAWIIGNDGGLLDAPVELGNITKAPKAQTDRQIFVEGAGRVDVVIDFSGVWKAGQSATDGQGWREVQLVNSAPFYWPGAPLTATSSLYHVMQFRVARPRSTTAQTITKLPASLPADPFAAASADAVASRANSLSGDKRVSRYGYTRAPQGHNLDPTQASISRSRNHTFSVAFDAALGIPIHLIDNLRYMDAVTEHPVLGTYESWRICNPMNLAHPVHLHAVTFYAVSRRTFDVAIFTASGDKKTVVFTGKPLDIAPQDKGWKDMVVTQPGECVDITVAVEGFAGEFEWHCHSLEHEDQDMMRPMKVLPPGSAQVYAQVDAKPTATQAVPTATKVISTTIKFKWTPEPLPAGPFTTHTVEVAPFNKTSGKYLMAYKPAELSIKLGDTVQWKWSGDPGQPHSVVHYKDATVCQKFSDLSTEKLFDDGSGAIGRPAYSEWSYQFKNRGTFGYACGVAEHCMYGMRGKVTVT